MPFMTYLAILAFVAILGSLGAALYFMLRGGNSQHAKSKNMADKIFRTKGSRLHREEK